ncbi:MAG: MraY family glycosyltransferase [Rhodospirillaceae bacterium]
MNGYTASLLCAVAFAVSCALTWVLTTGRARALALDRPNQRSLHRQPIPRTGGLAIVVAIVTPWLMFGTAAHRYVIVAAVLLSALSLIDDVRSLPVVARLIAHLAAATAAVAAMNLQLPLLLWLGAVLAIAWMINLYNFMDGSDGLAGGMALFGFFFYGCAAWRAGDVSFALANWSVAAAAAGFLVFNFHPARIFMGDSGSVPLGLLAAAFGMQGWGDGLWPLWFPALVFSPFIVDASVTLTRRIWQRQRIWEAHREHYYQRLVQLGWGHRRTALVEYVVMVLAGAAAVWSLELTGDGQSVVLGAIALLYMFAMLAIDAAWRTSAGAAP